MLLILAEIREKGTNYRTEYSENRTITQSGLFENEIGPGMLESSVQQT